MTKVTAFFFFFFSRGNFGCLFWKKKKKNWECLLTTNTKWTRSNCFWVEKEQFNLSHSIIFLPIHYLLLIYFNFFFLSLFFILIYLSLHNHLSLILNTPLVLFSSPHPIFFFYYFLLGGWGCCYFVSSTPIKLRTNLDFRYCFSNRIDLPKSGGTVLQFVHLYTCKICYMFVVQIFIYIAFHYIFFFFCITSSPTFLSLSYCLFIFILSLSDNFFISLFHPYLSPSAFFH